MINQTLKDDLLSLSIDKVDFSFRIPVKKLGNPIDWKIGAKESKGIVVKNVSKWALQLFTKNVTEEKFVQQFKDVVTEHSPNNSINWEDTLKAVTIQNYYNWLVSANKTAKEKKSEEEIIAILKEKYKLD